MSADNPDYLELVRLVMGLVDQMRRVYTLAKWIAKLTPPAVIARQD